MTTDANIAELRKVAAALGAGITREETAWQSGRVWCARGGRTFALEFHERPKRHVTISGLWPMYADASGCKRYVTPRDARAVKHNEAAPECRASADRDAASIARDFERRFFPEFARCWDACAAYRVKLDKSAAAALDAAQEFAREFGGEAKADGGSYGLSPSAKLYVGTVGLIVFDSWDTGAAARIERNLGSLSLDTARRILRILAEEEHTKEAQRAKEASRADAA